MILEALTQATELDGIEPWFTTLIDGIKGIRLYGADLQKLAECDNRPDILKFPRLCLWLESLDDDTELWLLGEQLKKCPLEIGYIEVTDQGIRNGPWSPP